MSEWRSLPLGNILTESKLESAKPDPDKRITVKLNVKGVEKRPFEAGVEGGTKYFRRKAGQFIYGKQNLFKGAFGLVPKELDGFESSQDIPAFDISKDCLPEWLMLFLKQGEFYKSLESIATGTGSRRIQPSKLFEVEIPLPTIAEQKKIIQRISEYEQKHSSLTSEISSQLSDLQRLRQSILQEAVQGKLVPQDKNDEPASELLKKINAEKEALIKAGKLKKEKPLPPISEDEIPFELPEGWVWCRAQNIAQVDSGSTPDKKEFTENEGDIPYLKVYNIVNQKVAFMYKPQYIKRTCHLNQLKRSICSAGNVIMNIVGPPLGKVALIPEEIEECNINQAIVVFRPYISEFNKWIYNYLCEMSAISSIVTKGTAGQANISLTQARELLIPLPPLTEQHRIVTKVESLLQTCDALEAELKGAQEDAGKLLQAVLREGFEG